MVVCVCGKGRELLIGERRKYSVGKVTQVLRGCL